MRRAGVGTTMRPMAESDSQTVDDYLAAQPAPARAILERARATIRKALPRATERISYRIPVFEIDGRMVLYLAGFRHHYSIYPTTERLVAALGLAGLLHSKGTIRFSYTDPIPTRLVTKIAKHRAAEAADLDRAKAAKKKAAKKKRAPGKTPKAAKAASSAAPPKERR
jgi:uncharacterized protein YdhG (YjbR/CyaY superfamily)